MKLEDCPELKPGPCEHWDPHREPVGIYYCDECNSICLFSPFPEKAKEVKEEAVETISHETLHWVLLKEVNEEACNRLDVLTGDGTPFSP